MEIDYKQGHYTRVDIQKLQEQQKRELEKKLLEDSKDIARHLTAKLSGVDVVGDIQNQTIVITTEVPKKKDDEDDEQ